jgi:cell fate (sporulation/competence/biofilm development) regulator YlbF (YheA/YmcA/DUF963 family)
MSSVSHSQDDLIQMIIRQTNYTDEEARDKLIEHNNDSMTVIREYMGIKKEPNTKKTLNQQIYKEIRKQLDTTVREYNERKLNGNGKISL